MKNKHDDKVFVTGYNCAIQNMAFHAMDNQIDVLATAVRESGISKKEFKSVQKESGFMNSRMKNIFSIAFEKDE